MMFLLLACTPNEGDTGKLAPYEPAPYIVPEVDPPTASFSVEDLEASMAEALSMAQGLTGAAVFPSYFAVMEGADPDCPNYYEQDGNIYWYDSCTSTQGSAFNGYSFYYHYDHYVQGDEVHTGDALAGVAQVWDADGNLFLAGGTAYDLLVEGDGYQYWYSIAQGAFSYDGPEGLGTWLEDGLSPDMIQYAYHLPASDARGYVMQGTVSGISGAFNAAVFDGIYMFDEGLAAYAGGNCSAEPGGVVSMRDGDGNWYDILFDGYSDSRPRTPEGMCDGCGEAYFRGDDVGTVCVDFTGLNAWEGAPW